MVLIVFQLPHDQPDILVGSIEAHQEDLMAAGVLWWQVHLAPCMSIVSVHTVKTEFFFSDEWPISGYYKNQVIVSCMRREVCCNDVHVVVTTIIIQI